MWNFLKKLFESNKQFNLSQQATLKTMSETCDEILKVAETIADGEDKNKLIDEVNKYKASIDKFHDSLA